MSSSNYSQFNAVINEVYFDGRYQSIPIYLDLEDKERNEASEKIPLPPADFDQELGSAVARTLCWDRPNIYEWHLDNLRKWRVSTGSEPPPFSAILLTFSLAAEHMRQGDEYSANNYYQRLAEIYGTLDKASKNKLSGAGKYTLIFWETLNQWLRSTDFIYGRPTARQVNSWTYVSYSISQSLVRDGDKKTLQKMFIHYGFIPHQVINESEMKLYLNEWMTSTGPSVWLKKLWGSNDLRDRVVAAACSELEVWEGSPFEINLPDSVTKLTLAIALQKFPRVRVNLFLITTIHDEFTGDSLKLPNNQVSSQLKEALNNGDDLWLSELSGTRVAYLEPTLKLNINTLINSSFDLQGNNLKKYRRDARPIAPLIKLEGSSIYREVPKVSLFENHILLCHKKWGSTVNDYLAKHARSGYSIKNSQEIEGLPLEWVVFIDVEIINIADDDVSDNLQCLVPLSEGECIYLTGGLRLAPGVWHAMAPPEVFASDGNGLLGVQIKSNEFIDDPNAIFQEISAQYNPAFLKERERELDSKNLILFTTNNGKNFEKDISFRTATTPRKLITHRNSELFYCLDKNNKTNLYSAKEIKESNTNLPHVRGLSFFGTPPQTTPLSDLGEIKLLDVNFSTSEDWKNYNLSAVTEDMSACIVRGHHYWLVTPDSKSMTCRDCNQFQIVRKKGRKKKATHSLVRTNSISHSIHKVDALQQKQTNKISMDIAFDAICYLGSGNWNQIQSILSGVVELPWYVNIANKNLVDYGYIDQSLRDGRSTPNKWSCSPPSLTITEHGTAFISGFRNEPLIAELKLALATVTAEYKIINYGERLLPASHIWHLDDTDISRIKRLISEIKDPHARHIEVQFSSGQLIAESLPFISEILDSLPQIHIEAVGEIEKFDIQTCKWLSSRLAENGAYRTNFAGMRYFYHQNGESREASQELVKLMAARKSGAYLHQYDLNNSTLECFIGCDPPGLFKRALISCSGEFPINIDDKTVYSQIPKSLAKLIMYKMYK